MTKREKFYLVMTALVVVSSLAIMWLAWESPAVGGVADEVVEPRSPDGAARLRGRVVNSAGDPIARAVVMASDRRATCDDEGVFEFSRRR